MDTPQHSKDSPNWNDAVASVQGGMEFRDLLLERLQQHTALPFMFIGSGLSRRYLGIPDWEGMLRKFTEQIGIDFDYLISSASNDLPRAASILAKDFHPRWFKDEQYEDQRRKYKNAVRDREAPLKVAVAEYMASRSALGPGQPGVDDSDLKLELSRLSDAVIDGVITTNYDKLTDLVFPDFPYYIGQDDLLLSDAQFVGEVYKIHGSCEEPSSLVLTEADYQDFMGKNSYLAAKLLTIFAEHPVIFIGYSISDKYIRSILNSIALAVGASRLHQLQERIYFVEWNSNPAIAPSISTTQLEVLPGQLLPVTSIETHSFLPLFDALSSLSRPFPARILRHLRKQVYELVVHPDPGQSIKSVRALPIDSNKHEDLRVVFGVGRFTDTDIHAISSIGYRAITRDDLARDILDAGDAPLDALHVLNVALPELLRVTSTAYLPVMKYLREAERLTPGASMTISDLDESVQRLITRKIEAQEYIAKRFARDVNSQPQSPRELIDSDLADYYRIGALLCIPPDSYPLDELKEVLRDLLDNVGDLDSSERTHLFRAIAYYDRLRWGVSS